MPLSEVLPLLLQLLLDESLLHDVLREDGHLLGGGNSLLCWRRDGEVGGRSWWEHERRHSAGRSHGVSLSLEGDQLQHGQHHVPLSLLHSRSTLDEMKVSGTSKFSDMYGN